MLAKANSRSGAVTLTEPVIESWRGQPPPRPGRRHHLVYELARKPDGVHPHVMGQAFRPAVGAIRQLRRTIRTIAGPTPRQAIAAVARHVIGYTHDSQLC